MNDDAKLILHGYVFKCTGCPVKKPFIYTKRGNVIRET